MRVGEGCLCHRTLGLAAVLPRNYDPLHRQPQPILRHTLRYHFPLSPIFLVLHLPLFIALVPFALAIETCYSWWPDPERPSVFTRTLTRAARLSNSIVSRVFRILVLVLTSPLLIFIDPRVARRSELALLRALGVRETLLERRDTRMDQFYRRNPLDMARRFVDLPAFHPYPAEEEDDYNWQ